MSAQEKRGFAAPVTVFVVANSVSFTTIYDVTSYRKEGLCGLPR